MTTIDQRENSHVFSIMKGLGIIFVVAGHTAYSPVHNFVYLFHLAVFYFVAGYFFKDKDSTPEHPVFNRTTVLKDSYKPE